MQAWGLDHVDHERRQRAGGGGNHARPSARDGGDHRDAERGIQADLRIDPGDARERDGLGDQGQGDEQAGQDFPADIADPLLAQRIDDGPGITPATTALPRSPSQSKIAYTLSSAPGLPAPPPS